MVTQVEQWAIATVDPVIEQYFEDFNREDYAAVAALLNSDGVLRPPFEEGLIGPEAIQDYLMKEARGMRAIPLGTEVQALESGQRHIIITGRVKALVFIVNVQWTFIVNDDNTILDAHIKLLASLQELMQINRSE